MERFKEKLNSYANTMEARNWLEQNIDRVKALFTNVRLRDFILEPFRGVFSLSGDTAESRIKQVITQVAVINMVLAGLPGKMGVGVFVSMALEAWMAYTIAREVGVRVGSVSDIWKYFGMLATVAVTILFLFRSLIGLGYSAFSLIPGINPLIFAELFTTNLVGVLFWVGFQEVRKNGSFKIPMRMVRHIWSETKSLYDFQYQRLKCVISPSNLKRVGTRLSTWLKGEIPVDQARLRGDLLVSAGLMSLKFGEYSQLEGPIGVEFIGAIRDRYPELADATVEKIADHFSQYDTEQMFGVTNLIKGKLFERLIERAENADDDQWRAVLHSDESYPGSDIIFISDDTGESIEFSIKATSSPYYIEESLSRYPDIPIITVSEHTERYDDDPMIGVFDMSNEELNTVTSNNFDALLSQLTRLDVIEAAGSGVALGAIASLWPFTVAYWRKRITQEQMEQAYERVLGDAGVALASRISYAVLLGPVFAWYLLARAVKAGLDVAEPEQVKVSTATRRIVLSFKQPYSP